ALGQYWIQRRFLGEGQRWLETLDEAATDAVPLEIRLESAAFAAFCASLRLNAEAAKYFGKKAMKLSESADDPYLNLIATASYGGYFAVIGKNDRAYSLVKRSLELAHQINDPFNIGMASFNLAIHAMALDKYDEAQNLIKRSLNNAGSAGDPFRIGHSYKVLGDLHRLRRSWPEAVQAYRQALEVFEESQAVSNVAMVMHDLANVLVHQGRLDQAKTMLKQAVKLNWGEGNRHGVKETLLGYGVLALALDKIDTAFLILTSLETLINQPAVSFYPASQRDHAVALEKIQAGLPESRLPALRVRGKQLSLEEAIALGQSLTVDGEDIAPILTPRQSEVAALIAMGMSNSEIAERLLISKRTVEKHIANILSRLGVRNRVDIVRWAMENRLAQRHL
ncbi:MAG: tetratricopeptide repeat protein, partial [Anaerolineales bacterium]